MKNLLNAYKATTAAAAYIIGFLMNDKVYTICLNDLPEWLIAMDRESTSHGGARKLRIRMTTIARHRLLNLGAAYIGTAKPLNSGSPRTPVRNGTRTACPTTWTVTSRSTAQSTR